MSYMLKNKQILVIFLFLTCTTLTAFWQVIHCDFINFDDTSYVTENIQIRNGITAEAIRWAFTTGHSSNWHPVTWISHMLDVQFFGLKPGCHHLTNLLFHIASTLLLFCVFHQMTKAPWKSAFVAALFALHPLHVESVAWVAERKDVLSTFFWMLTMVAYIHYVEHPRLKNYLSVLIFFAVGLMAKPMLVTLPFVLLLLDYWPLQRLQEAGSGNENTNLGAIPLLANKGKGKSSRKHRVQTIIKDEKPAEDQYQWALIRPLLREKLPLFALATLSSVVTYVAQEKGGSVASFGGIPLGVRIENAWVSYIIYMGKTVWPSNLAVYYPHPGLWPFWQVMGAVLLLGAVTFAVIKTATRIPYLAVGWLWYAGTLVPVIGIVQVGRQAMADRYTYIPLIGLFVIVAWGIPELLKKWRYRKEALFVSSALVLLSLSIVTRIQIGYWRNSIALYDHCLKVTSPSDIILSNRGVASDDNGNHRQAISDYDRAIEINPKYADAYNNRGVSYGKLGNHRQAISDYGRAIEINPQYADAYYNRGVIYGLLDNNRQAISDFDRVIEINPQYAGAYYNRGMAYGKLGNHRQAISNFDRAVEINPEYAGAYHNRGVIYGLLDNNRQAISDFDRTIEIDPGFSEAYCNRGVAYDQLGNLQHAISDYNRAIEINSEYGDAYHNRGIAYGKLGNQEQAIEDLQKAARLGNEDAKNLLKSQGIRW